MPHGCPIHARVIRRLMLNRLAILMRELARGACSAGQPMSRTLEVRESRHVAREASEERAEIAGERNSRS